MGLPEWVIYWTVGLLGLPGKRSHWPGIWWRRRKGIYAGAADGGRSILGVR